MPDYQYPGVYIEAVERGPRPIEGVPTSTAALLGEAERGSITREVFDLHGRPTASRVYAWAHDADDPGALRRHVTVLHGHPIESARHAVRAAIVQEFRNLEST